MRTKKMKKENLFRTHSFFNNSIAKSSFQGLRLELPPESELLADVLQFRRLPGTFDRRRFRFVFRNCPPPPPMCLLPMLYSSLKMRPLAFASCLSLKLTKTMRVLFRFVGIARVRSKWSAPSLRSSDRYRHAPGDRNGGPVFRTAGRDQVRVMPELVILSIYILLEKFAWIASVCCGAPKGSYRCHHERV